MLLPGTNLLLGGGKEGVLYVLDANNLGRKVTNDTQIPQKIAVNGGHVMGGPVYWNSATGGTARLQLVGIGRVAGLSSCERDTGDATLRAGNGQVARAPGWLVDRFGERVGK